MYVTSVCYSPLRLVVEEWRYRREQEKKVVVEEIRWRDKKKVVRLAKATWRK